MTTTTTTNAPPQVIWVYRYREDDIDSLNDVLSSGLITHVFIKLLHRDDMKISWYESHEYKVPLAIARCQEFGIPVIFCRNLWPSWDLQIYETGTQGQWSSQNPEHLEGDIVIHNKIVSGIIRKIYYKANKDTSEEPGTGDDWDELSPKDFAEGVWYNSDFYENEIRELKLDVSSGGIAEGADYISLDVEAYANALVWFQTKGGPEHLSSEEQKNAIATAIATAIAAEGKVDYTLPAGSNGQDGDHVPTYYAALGNIRICERTYYDREVPVNILYDWEMFGAFINTTKDNPENPPAQYYLVHELFDNPELWNETAGLFMWREDNNAYELAKAVANSSAVLAPLPALNGYGNNIAIANFTTGWYGDTQDVIDKLKYYTGIWNGEYGSFLDYDRGTDVVQEKRNNYPDFIFGYYHSACTCQQDGALSFRGRRWYFDFETIYGLDPSWILLKDETSVSGVYNPRNRLAWTNLRWHEGDEFTLYQAAVYKNLDNPTDDWLTYVCILPHTASSANAPDGVDGTTHWILVERAESGVGRWAPDDSAPEATYSVWNEHTEYKKGDFVIDGNSGIAPSVYEDDGVFYICIKDIPAAGQYKPYPHWPQNNIGEDDLSEYWQCFPLDATSGNYEPSRIYYGSNTVLYDNVLYVCILAHGEGHHRGQHTPGEEGSEDYWVELIPYGDNGGTDWRFYRYFLDIKQPGLIKWAPYHILRNAKAQEWSSTVRYEMLHRVIHEGQSFEAIRPNTNINPIVDIEGSGLYWKIDGSADINCISLDNVATDMWYHSVFDGTHNYPGFKYKQLEYTIDQWRGVWYEWLLSLYSALITEGVFLVGNHTYYQSEDANTAIENVSVVVSGLMRELGSLSLGSHSHNNAENKMLQSDAIIANNRYDVWYPISPATGTVERVYLYAFFLLTKDKDYSIFFADYDHVGGVLYKKDIGDPLENRLALIDYQDGDGRSVWRRDFTNARAICNLTSNNYTSGGLGSLSIDADGYTYLWDVLNEKTISLTPDIDGKISVDLDIGQGVILFNQKSPKDYDFGFDYEEPGMPPFLGGQERDLTHRSPGVIVTMDEGYNWNTVKDVTRIFL